MRDGVKPLRGKPARLLLGLALSGIALGGCRHQPLSPEQRAVSERMINCDEMAQVFRTSKRFGFHIDLGAIGGGANAELQRVQLPASQVMSMRAMIMECRLWALGVKGHDADHFSEMMLRLAGVYVAADEQQMRDRLKVLEEALGKLKNGTGRAAIVITEEMRVAIQAKGAAIFIDPTLALAIVNSGTLDELRRLLARSNARNDDADFGISELDRRLSDLDELGRTRSDEIGRVVAALREKIASLEEREKRRGGAVMQLPQSRPDESLYFATNVSIVSPEASTRLESFIRSLRDRGVKAVDVIGFADRRGSERHNAVLSLARARAVAVLLTRGGIQVRHILSGGETGEFGAELTANRQAWIVSVQ